jgi:SAM-dependent MidA family methyltransferase
MNTLACQIEEEIRQRGPISFARFMELALYAPGLGYYERKRPMGRDGDFFTSVSVGPLFGQLLAFQFAQWMDADASAGGIQFIEAGSHDGVLAADILNWTSRRRPDLYERLEYWILETSPSRRGWQEETLRPWLSKVNWAPGVESAVKRDATTIIFSNEFLDAMPVHRLAWNAARPQWREGFVKIQDKAFAWEWQDSPVELTAYLPKVPWALAEVMPDGFILEVCPAAMDWWRSAAASLKRGKLMTIDYGFSAGEPFQPERAQGTLRTYARHHVGGDVLNNPGEEDLTAHVNFAALIQTGEAAGLQTEGLVRQSKFLTDIFAQTRSHPASFGPWDEKQTRQFKTLAHPEHLGHTFQVLVQTRQ